MKVEKEALLKRLEKILQKYDDNEALDDSDRFTIVVAFAVIESIEEKDD